MMVSLKTVKVAMAAAAAAGAMVVGSSAVASDAASGVQLCIALVKSSPAVSHAGWSAPAIVKLKKIPTCESTYNQFAYLTWPGLPGPYQYTFVKTGKKTIQLTDNIVGGNPAIPKKGAAVVFG